MNFTAKENVVNPEESAGFLSKLFFHWTMPLFKKAKKIKLTVNDLYDVVKEDESEKLGNQLEIQWSQTCEEAKKIGKSPKLFDALSAIYGCQFLVMAVMITINQCFLRIAPAVFVRLFITEFNDDSGTMENRILYAIGICGTSMLNNLSTHWLHFTTCRIGIRCSVASTSLIFRKMLCLTTRGQSKTGVGELINLLSNDATEFKRLLPYTIHLFATPFQLCIFTYILWQEFGVFCLSGIGFALFLIPLQYTLGVISSRVRMKLSKRRDQRARLMNEFLSAIRVIKMYAWEKPFSILINSLRILEIQALRQNAYLRASNVVIFNISNRTLLLFTLITYSMTGNPLTADKVFFAVSVFYTMNNAVMLVLPEGITIVGHIRVVLKRLENFLHLTEVEQSLDNFQVVDKDLIMDVKPIVEFNAVHGAWTLEKPTLSNISWRSSGNQLIMVVGSVGAGKSSFLNALLGELPITKGKCVVHGRTSYASQEPWIFAGSIRQNILFGRPYDASRYEEVVRNCSLEEDMKQWPHGDLSLAGERGVTLSGGQRARISLARALYVQADIYLLDDPLSAVDARVSRHLFNNCFLKYLANKMTILVTHQLQYLSQADHIIVLNQGEMIANGTYSELMDQNINLMSLLGADNEKQKNRESVISEVDQVTKSESSTAPVEAKEQMAGGAVTWRTYWNYVKSGNSVFYFPTIFAGFILLHSLTIVSDFWLSHWTSEEERFVHSRNFTTFEDTTEIPEQFDRQSYILTYSGFILVISLGFAIISAVYYTYFMQVGINFHDRLFVNVARAPVKFFDENSSGRIMNRFTKDLGSVDTLLPHAIYEVIEIFLKNASVLVILIVTNYYMIFSTTFVFFMMILTRNFYMHTALQLKRIESTARSPMYSHLSATFEGLVTVRALRCQHVLTEQFDSHQDLNTSAGYILNATGRWFGNWIQVYCILYLGLVTFMFIFLSPAENSSTVGLGISAALTLSSIQWALRLTAETENLMTSVERILEYTSVQSEAPLESDPEVKPATGWPSMGEIKFDNVTLSYGETQVLKNLSFRINSQEKIGVVGRTGAGKSSIISALFRMTEVDGEIVIDGVRVQRIGLHDLRSKLSIIPQDPVLFSGTVRYNLDPFDQFEDSELWQALEDVELKNEITALDFIVENKGGNFSVGQRQLMCLARAILRRNKIIVLDEATANVDHETDALIQKTIRQKFMDCTIITIAHRLDSVMDCDKIIVMDNGMLMEFDHPAKLLEDSSGYLSLMVEQTGKASSEKLRLMAHAQKHSAQMTPKQKFMRDNF